MPHSKDDRVPTEAFDREARKLESLLKELCIEVPAGSDFATVIRRGFVAFYYSVYPCEGPPIRRGS